MTDTNPLQTAIETRVREYDKAIDRLRDLATDETENEVHDLTVLLREAIELARCLRRLTQGRTPAEIHAAFGSPGDFGYETPIGEALARVYREVLPELPPGYEWTAETRERAPVVLTPFGATLAGCFGESLAETIQNRAAAAWHSHRWLAENGAGSCVPAGVDPSLWWRFVSHADSSIYPHCLSHVYAVAEWRIFERLGLTRGAVAVCTDAARAGLRLAANSLSGRHADEWLKF